MDLKKDEIDLLKRVEELTAKINKNFGEKSHSALSRYPLTFALLILFGVTLVTQGLKDLMLEIPFFQHRPLTMLFVGLLILIITGTLYKKLKNK
jgi:hypothetical protein